MENIFIKTQQKTSSLKQFLANFFSRRDKMEKDIVGVASNHGFKLEKHQIDMIMGTIQMGGYQAEKIKIPTTRMVTLPVSASLSDTIDTIRKSGHSRIPLFEENEGIKDYIGLLYAKELLVAMQSKIRKFNLKDYIRPIKVVPETQMLLTLLRDMQQNRSHLVLTANEYGEVTGLITLEDILEEVVGDILDESDKKIKGIVEIEHRLYRIDGWLPLSDVNKFLHTALPEEKFNSLAGLLLHELKGELKPNANIRIDGATLTLEKVSGQKIEKVLVQLDLNS